METKKPRKSSSPHESLANKINKQKKNGISHILDGENFSNDPALDVDDSTEEEQKTDNDEEKVEERSLSKGKFDKNYSSKFKDQNINIYVKCCSDCEEKNAKSKNHNLIMAAFFSFTLVFTFMLIIIILIINKMNYQPSIYIPPSSPEQKIRIDSLHTTIQKLSSAINDLTNKFKQSSQKQTNAPNGKKTNAVLKKVDSVPLGTIVLEAIDELGKPVSGLMLKVQSVKPLPFVEYHFPIGQKQSLPTGDYTIRLETRRYFWPNGEEFHKLFIKIGDNDELALKLRTDPAFN